jgi:hypothetical protein
LGKYLHKAKKEARSKTNCGVTERSMDDTLSLVERLKVRMQACTQGVLIDLSGGIENKKQTKPNKIGAGVKRKRAENIETKKTNNKSQNSKPESVLPFGTVASMDLALQKSERMKKESDLYTMEINEHARQNKYGEVARLHAATLIFGQEEGGSAVVVSSKGDILTCAHCLGSEPELGNQWCLLFGDGGLCLAEAFSIDERADLALLRCVGLFDENSKLWTPPGKRSFEFVEVCTDGSDDAAMLESATVGKKTDTGKQQSGRVLRRKQDLPIMCIGQSIVKRNLNLCISTGQYLGIYDYQADIR